MRAIFRAASHRVSGRDGVMRIAGIGVAVPGQSVSNQDIVQTIERERPRDTFSGAIARSILSLLEAAGSEIRYYRAPGELARDLTRTAMLGALTQCGLSPRDIDLVIYCSVGRGFLEPGNAYFCANLLGMRCECFDIADACMGWLRAANLAHDALAVRRHRRVMVVSAEFGVPQLVAQCCQIDSPLELRRVFTAFTLGEVATATVFEASDQTWSFTYRSRPDLADLCTLPLPGHVGFTAYSPRLARAKPLRLDAHSAELFGAAEAEMHALLPETVGDLRAPDLYVPHSASSTWILASAYRAQIPREKVFASIMPRFGNVVSASLPLGLFYAAREGFLRPNADVVLCPASAGLCVGIGRFCWDSESAHVAS